MTITLTDTAAARINALTATGEFAGQMLRLTINSGGCSGFEYKFSFTDAKNDDDTLFEHQGATLAVDEASLDLLEGTTLDYTESLMGAQFQIKNPNAVAGCGCGNSFGI